MKEPGEVQLFGALAGQHALYGPLMAYEQTFRHGQRKAVPVFVIARVTGSSLLENQHGLGSGGGVLFPSISSGLRYATDRL